METAVMRFIEERQLLTKNSTVLIGVSGGPDSMALLHLLCSIRKQWNLHLIAIAVDHQLRGEESEADIQYIEKICQKWNVQCVSKKIDVTTYKVKNKIGTQIAARELRYSIFAEQMKRFSGDYLALGHHGDDQIESMLMALSRTTNLKSLAGIPLTRYFSVGAIIRPLLCVKKREIVHYCNKYDINPRIDPSNSETYYTRNYFRAYIVPQLEKRNPNLHTTIQRLSETLLDDESYIIEEAMRVFHHLVIFNKIRQGASISVNSFKGYPISLQRRLFRLTLDYLYEKLPDSLSYVHEQYFLSLFMEDKGNMIIDFPNNLKIEKSYDNVLLYFRKDLEDKVNDQTVIESVPAEVILPDGAKMSVSYTDEVKSSDTYKYVCPARSILFPLHIRTRKPGDRMSWDGLQGTKKLKDIFIDEKVPRDERDNTWIVTDDNEEILWLVGLKKGKLKGAEHAPPYVLIEYKVDDI